MICKWAALLLLLCALTSRAATITSARSGDWNDSITWTGGVVPAAGDAVTVSHYLTVKDGSTLYGAITVGAGADLIFQGAATVDSTLTINGASADVTANYGSEVVFSDDATPLATVTNGTFTVHGKVRPAATSEGTADEVMVSVGASGTLALQGRALGQVFQVSDIDITTQTTSDNLTVTVGGSVRPNATHATIRGGKWSGMTFPVTVAGNQVTLDGALAQAYSVAAVVDSAKCGADSLSVVDTVIVPDERKLIGASVVYAGGIHAAVIHHVRNAAATDRTAFFVDRTFDASLVDVTDPYILTWGVFQGVWLEFYEYAQLWGADDLPATDNSIGGNSATGKDECRVAIVTASTATLDLDKFEIRWAGGSSTVYSVVAEVSVTADFDDGLFYQIAAGYGLEVRSTAATSISGVSYYQALGPNDGSHGAFVRANETGDAQSITIANSRAIGTQADFLQAPVGGTYTTSWNVYSDWGSGSFIDAADLKTYTSSHTGDRIYGAGETPFDYWGPDIAGTLSVNRVECYSGGNAQFRDIIGSHENAFSSTWGGFDIGGDWGAVTIANSRVEWSMLNLGRISTSVPTDTTRVVNSTFANYGFWADRDTFTAAAIAPDGNDGWGGWYLSSLAPTGSSIAVFEGCKFINPWRRGFDVTALNNDRTNGGAQIRGNNGTCRYDFRRCYFTMRQSVAELVQVDSDQGMIVTDDPDWTWGGVGYSWFDGVPVGIYVWRASGGHKVALHHNLFQTIDTAGSVSGRAVTIRNSTDGFTARFNTFVSGDMDVEDFQVYSGTQNNAFFGNLFLDNDDNREAIRFWSIADATATAFDYNYFAYRHDDVFTVTGETPGTLTLAEAEAKAYGWANNYAISDGTAALDKYKKIVTRLTGAVRLCASCPDQTPPATTPIDFVVGATDADGSVADAGYLPILPSNWGF